MTFGDHFDYKIYIMIHIFCNQNDHQKLLTYYDMPNLIAKFFLTVYVN